MEKNIYLYLTIIFIIYVLYRLNANFENFENPDNIKIYVKSKYNTNREKPPIPELSKIVPPKIEPPKIELPKIELPKIEPPKIEPSMIEFPKLEFPKIEFPKLEFPKLEFPKLEFPKIEFPKPEPPKPEPPKPEPPKIEQLKPEPPKIEPPKIEQLKPEPPKIEPSKPEPPKLNHISKPNVIKLIPDVKKIVQPYKKDIIRKIHDSVVSNTKETLKNSYKRVFGDDKPINTKTKTYVEQFMEYFYNTAKTCDFSYTILESTVRSENLTPGQMLYSNNQITIHYADANSSIGVNLILNNKYLTIQNTTSNKNYFTGIENISNDSYGNYVFTLNPSIDDSFFVAGNKYVIGPCIPDTEGNSTNKVIDNQIVKSLIWFGIFIIIIILVINYKYITSYIYNWFKKEKDIPDRYEGGKQIFYVGGYDYRDYSD